MIGEEKHDILMIFREHYGDGVWSKGWRHVGKGIRMAYKNYVAREFEDGNLCGIKPGEGIRLSVCGADLARQMEADMGETHHGQERAEGFCDYRLRLRLTGDVGIQQNWMWEGGFPRLYRLIDDALSTETRASQFSLKLEMDGEEWPRRAYFQLPCPPRLTPQFPAHGSAGVWQFSLWVKAEHLSKREGGKARFVIETYKKRPGVDVRDMKSGPDEVKALDFPEGTYGFTRLELPVAIGEDTACLLLYAECERAEGCVWLEEPKLVNGYGENVLPQFALTNPFHECFNWFGENLSRKEWTDAEVLWNGRVIFDGELFQRAHRYSENEMALPADAVRPGENTLEIRNKNHAFAPLPYQLKKVEILYEREWSATVAACPSVVYADRPFGVLVRTKRDGAQVHVASSSQEILPVQGDVILEKRGLHVLPFTAGSRTETDITIRVSCDGVSREGRIGRIVKKTEDHVLTGTGDAIYIPQETEDMEAFLEWYFQNDIGNFITFRPTYRWCGTKMLNRKLWEQVVSLCSAYGMYYCHMIDGRELSGANANPDRALLESEWFVGNQGHERDGAFYYWGPNRAKSESDTMQNALMSRTVRHPDWKYFAAPFFAPDGKSYSFYDPRGTRDMKEAAEHFVENCRYWLSGIKRHTGPSVLFKYFMEAGILVGGAETMYGPHEVVLSALRGASLAYGRTEFAAHLALQWSTTPHDTPDRLRRYQLSLFVSYIQGTHHINTEEGLWRMEEYFAHFDRFSETCQNHLEVQRQFCHFVKTHSRRGRMVNPTALLHGRYDAWTCFTRQNAWAHLGEAWRFGAPEESWDLIRVFYPDAVMDSIYRHPCEKKPQGFYSRTPYGAVDILPVEADESQMARYQAMAFLGWNSADEEQVEKLIRYVRQGGTLLLGWPHLFADTDRESALYGTPAPVREELLEELLGIAFHGFVKEDGRTGEMGDITVLEDTEVLEEAGGRPLVLRHALGEGDVLFVNRRGYPAEDGVREWYESLLHRIGEQGADSQKARGILASVDTVETGMFDREDGLRDIYAVNMNWWEEENRSAKAGLFFDGREYPVWLNREVIHIFTLANSLGVWTSDFDTDVIAIEEREDSAAITLQGYGRTKIRLIVGDLWDTEEMERIERKDGILEGEVALHGCHVLRCRRKMG